MDIAALLQITPEEVLIAKRAVKQTAQRYAVTLSAAELNDITLDVCFRHLVKKGYVPPDDIWTLIRLKKDFPHG